MEYRIDWIDPNTIRPVQHPTGTLRITAPGIELDIEVFNTFGPLTNPVEYITRAVNLLLRVQRTQGITVGEPESEPEPLPPLTPAELEPVEF
jgi:hypothetical protein